MSPSAKPMKWFNFFNLYEVKRSLGLIFLQHFIRYAESNLSFTNLLLNKCNLL
jgi:hypothetical protein